MTLGGFRILKYNSNGNYLTKLNTTSSGGNPVGMAVDSSGNIYVTTAAFWMNFFSIEKFDSNGNLLFQKDGYGGQFAQSYDIAVDYLNNIYVADYAGNRIQKFDSNGNLITAWGSNGTYLIAPKSVGVDSSGNVYVLNGFPSIQKFAPEGKTTPTITWSSPADIIYGAALSSTQLNAGASVPGTFAYNPIAGALLSVGTHTLHVDFTPTDTANYNSASKDVTINVSPNL